MIDDDAQSRSADAAADASGVASSQISGADDAGADAPAVLDDPQTDRAVDDIVAHESDELLAAEDEARDRLAPEKSKHGFWRALGSKPARRIYALLLIGGIAAAVGLPISRYWLLNKAGVQASSTVTVVDELTQQPMKGVHVSVGAHEATTNAQGFARVTGLSLGPATLHISQTGFATVSRQLTIGWGSNQQGTVKLHAVGVRFTLEVHDALSGKPIAGAEATDGTASATSDKNGRLTITFDNASVPAAVSVSKSGFRTEQVPLRSPADVTPANLITDRKAVFVLKENGAYNVYKSDADGKNRELLLAGNGNETDNIGLAVSPDGTHAAVVSVRDNQRDADGNLLNTLTLISLQDKSSVTLAHAAQIQLIDWIGQRLVFEQVLASSSTPASSRYTVISYDASANVRFQLAAAAHLSVVFGAQGAVYFGVAASTNDPNAHPAFYKINPDGSGRQIVLDKEVWSGERTDYNTLSVQTADGWSAYDIATGNVATVATPTTFISRQYVDNAAGTASIWVDADAHTLQVHDHTTGKDRTAQTLDGMSGPVRWLSDDAVIFRTAADGVTADYAASITGGSPVKIADVVNTHGFSQGQ